MTWGWGTLGPDGRRRAAGIVAVMIVGIVVAAGIAVPSPSSPSCAQTWSGTTTTPIRHLFLLIQENHAFENYFGDLPGVIGYPPNGSFPVSFETNETVSPFPLAGYTTPDFQHDRGSELGEWNGGLNNLFVAHENAAGYPMPQDTVGYYTQSQLAGYYALARNYGLGDRFFSGVMGPTAPNRVFDLTGFSGDGWYSDTPPPGNVTAEPTVLGQLSENGIPWAYDYAGPEIALAPTFFPAIYGDPCQISRVQPASDLASQLAGPAVPSVVYVDSSNSPTVSEHPSENISVGEAWTISNIDAILRSPVGNSSMILLFYDEAGGFWDPVPPPMTATGLDGFRVPFLVISPWTPAGTVCSSMLDPASVLQFIDTNWGLPYLNDRVATANGLGCFLHFGSTSPSP